MRSKLFAWLLVFVLIQSGCENNDNEDDNSALFAEVSWSLDVTNIDMIEVGVNTSDIAQNQAYQLELGEGTIYWKSGGKEYSKTVNIGESGIEDADDDVECEQEGEHEGENEGCVFYFSFSGNELMIGNR